MLWHAGPTVVVALRSRGVSSIDAVAASHAHADHIGGYHAVLSRLPVARFYDSGYPSTSSNDKRPLITGDVKNIRLSTLTAGQTIDLDPAIRIDMLITDGTTSPESHDSMLVLQVSYGSVSFLLSDTTAVSSPARPERLAAIAVPIESATRPIETPIVFVSGGFRDRLRAKSPRASTTRHRT